MNLVLDSCAFIALLAGEPGGELAAEALDDPATECHMHAINLCEVYYHVWRAAGEEPARRVVGDIRGASVTIFDLIDEPLMLDAGWIKGKYRRIALADCLAVALARRLEGELATTDRKELEPIAKDGVCGVRFLR